MDIVLIVFTSCLIFIMLLFVFIACYEIIKDDFKNNKNKLTKEQLDKLYKLLDEEGGTNGKT